MRKHSLALRDTFDNEHDFVDVVVVAFWNVDDKSLLHRPLAADKLFVI